MYTRTHEATAWKEGEVYLAIHNTSTSDSDNYYDDDDDEDGDDDDGGDVDIDVDNDERYEAHSPHNAIHGREYRLTFGARRWSRSRCRSYSRRRRHRVSCDVRRDAGGHRELGLVL